MPLANKSKSKGRDARQSRSRNTTPSSGHSASTAAGASGYLDSDLGKLFAQNTVQYAEILDQVGGSGSIPDVRSLEQLSDQLKTLSQVADTRGDTCNAAIRELSQRKKDVVEDPREQEMERDTEDRKMKREADDEDDASRALKGGKLKKRKERSSKEDRPLAVGAHEATRQDGGELGLSLEYVKLRNLLDFILTFYLQVTVNEDSKPPLRHPKNLDMPLLVARRRSLLPH